MAFLNRCRRSRWYFVLLLSQVLVIQALAFSKEACAAAGSYQPVASTERIRFGAGSFLLPDGRALLLLGRDDTATPVRGGETYDPFTNSWSDITLSAVGRDESTATRLADGRILVTGGWIDGYPPVSAEIYDPVSDSWQAAGEMIFWRFRHAAVLLPDGRVLVTGGGGEDGNPVATAEIYDPVSNSWSPAPDMAQGRMAHTATLLPSGKVLVASGALSPDVPVTTPLAELFDPVSGTWSAAADLTVGRSMHRATVIAGGKVLVTGGMDLDNNGIQQSEIYDPAVNAWTTTGNLTYGRYIHTATLLNDGKVLVTGGGSGGPSDPARTTEIFDPATGTWEAGATLSQPMAGHTATLMLNGQVLLAGGSWWYQSPVPTGLYTPSGLDPAAPKTLSVAMTGSGSVRSTPAGIDCLEGLCSADFPYGSAIELIATATPWQVFTGWSGCDKAAFNKCTVNMSADKTVTAHFAEGPARFLPAPSLNEAHDSHTATLLPGGKVLVTGGDSFTATIYDPAANSWNPTAHTNEGWRSEPHTATVLSDGKVLVVGGEWSLFGGHSYGEVYDPVADRWDRTLTTSFQGYRHAHTATLLTNGKVLVAGGASGSFVSNVLADAELYTPSTNGFDGGSWNGVVSLSKARHSHTATVLPGGRVLVVGGTGASGSVLSSTEIFDAGTNLWSAGPPLATARTGHSATLLPDGRVLVVGGLGAAGVVASAEIFDPSTHSWSSTGPLIAPRTRHAAVLQPSGRVLVTGGVGSSNVSLDSAELYNPVTGVWTPAQFLIDPRADHTATLLGDGRTLIVAGTSAGQALSTVELYGPGVFPTGDTSAPSSFISTVYSTVWLEVTGTATDDSGTGVRRVEVSVDGGTTWAPVKGTLNWSYLPGPLPNGQYNIVTRAVDYAGNVETYGTPVPVTISAPLTVTIADPIQGETVSGAASTVSGTVSGSWWITKVELTFDGGATWQLASGRRSWFMTVPLAVGVRTVQARAYDEAGNMAYSAPVSFTVAPDDATGVVAPEASFTAAPLSGYAPLFVELSDTTLNNATSWSWEFGDGGRSSQRNPIHTFEEAGTYRVKLTVGNAAGFHAREVQDFVLVQVCPNLPVRDSSGSSFGSIQDAFDSASPESTVFVQAKSFTGDVVLSRDVTLVLKGGYDCGYTMNPAAANIRGTLKVAAGTLKVESLVFR